MIIGMAKAKVMMPLITIDSFESKVDQTLHALKRDLQPDEDHEPAFKKARKLLLLAHSYKLSFEKKW